MEFLNVLIAAENLFKHRGHCGSVQFMLVANKLQMTAMVDGYGVQIMEIKKSIDFFELKHIAPELRDKFLWDQVKSLADELIEYKISQKNELIS